MCILFIKPGHLSYIEWGRKSLPYSNFIEQSGKSAMSSTPIFLINSGSVRGTEMPGRLVALESKTSFDVSFALSIDFSFDLCLVFAACHLFTISESSFWYDRITRWTGNPSIFVVVVVGELVSCALVVVMLELLGPVKVELVVVVKLELLGAVKLEPVAVRLEPVAAMLELQD